MTLILYPYGPRATVRVRSVCHPSWSVLTSPGRYAPASSHHPMAVTSGAPVAMRWARLAADRARALAADVVPPSPTISTSEAVVPFRRRQGV